MNCALNPAQQNLSSDIEYRPPDPAANPYIAFAAMLKAGLDGIQNKIDQGEPMDKNLYELPPEKMAKVKQVPGSLDQAIAALEEGPRFPAQRGCLQ